MAITAKTRYGGIDKFYVYLAKLNATADGYDLLQVDLTTPVSTYADYALFIDGNQKVDFLPQNDGTCNIACNTVKRDDALLTFLNAAAQVSSDDTGGDVEEITLIDGTTVGGATSASADDVLAIGVGYSSLGSDNKHHVMVGVGKVPMEAYQTAMEGKKYNMTNFKINGVELSYDLAVTSLIDTGIVNLSADTPTIDVSTGRMFIAKSYAATAE